MRLSCSQFMALGFCLCGLLHAPLTQANNEPSTAQDSNQTSPLSGKGSGDFTQARAGGSRGCASAELPSGSEVVQSGLILLVSQPDGVLRTRSPRPTFAWYVRDAGQWPLELRIYRQHSQAPSEEVLRLRDDQHFLSQQGLMTLTLPDHEPPLETGERYLWQVVMQCEPDEPSSYLFATAHLEVVNNQAPISVGALPPLDSSGASAFSPVPGVSPLDSAQPAVLKQEKLNRWLKQRLPGPRSHRPLPSAFPWQYLGLSEAEALAIENSPIHAVGLPPAQ